MARASQDVVARRAVTPTGPLPDGTRVLIVSDVRLYREGLAQVLAAAGGIDVVGTAAHWDETAAGIAATSADVALLDMQLHDGREAVRRMLGASPHLKVVVLAIRESEEEVLAWAEAGIAGYVSREGSVDDLLDTIASVARGEIVCPPRISASLLRRVATLASSMHAPPIPAFTYRENEVLDLIELGLSNKEIASRLYIALPTVKNHVHSILEKLQVHRRADALAALGRSARTRRLDPRN